MTIKSDRWISRMTEPFEPNQIRQANGRKLVSCGTCIAFFLPRSLVYLISGICRG